MRCDQAQVFMDRYLSENLSAHERESFEVHLRHCRDCQQQLASLRRLVGALENVPAPPVPRDFADRVLARARQEIQGPPHFVAARSALSRWWERRSVSGLTNTIGAIAAGLLLGLALGQQTWRQVDSSNGPKQPTAGVDTEIVYSLDYLSGTPRGSYMQSYLSLTNVASDQEF
ncbi:MAG: zf-HC2 domain-containing protein [Pirellulales bacterium]|nr:zf-HC2 domain-containing protein [Pirellulales bacterium]